MCSKWQKPHSVIFVTAQPGQNLFTKASISRPSLKEGRFVFKQIGGHPLNLGLGSNKTGLAKMLFTGMGQLSPTILSQHTQCFVGNWWLDSCKPFPGFLSLRTIPPRETTRLFALV
jgi:hypothetical protein